MYDRRVARGSTHTHYILPAVCMNRPCFCAFLRPLSFLIIHYLQIAQPDPAGAQRQQVLRRRAVARKQDKEHLRTMTPEAVLGRKHIDVQTGKLLLLTTNVY